MSDPGIQTNNSGVSAAMMESIELELGELELSADDTPEVIEEIEPELSADQERNLEAALDRVEIYDAAPVTAMTEAPALSDGGPKSEKAKTPKGPKAPRATRDVADLPAGEFKLDLNGDEDSANKTAVLALRPKQVKVAEKFDNLFVNLSLGKAPSIYIRDCFKALDAKGSATSADLVNIVVGSTSSSGKNKGAGKALGTARSQAGQIMNLFAAIGVADRVGQTLTLRPTSTIAARLRAVV